MSKTPFPESQRKSDAGKKNPSMPMKKPSSGEGGKAGVVPQTKKHSYGDATFPHTGHLPK